MGMSGLDAVGIVVAQAQEVWKRGKIVGPLLMNVAAASSSVARRCFLRKVRNMGIDENLVG